MKNRLLLPVKVFLMLFLALLIMLPTYSESTEASSKTELRNLDFEDVLISKRKRRRKKRRRRRKKRRVVKPAPKPAETKKTTKKEEPKNLVHKKILVLDFANRNEVDSIDDYSEMLADVVYKTLKANSKFKLLNRFEANPLIKKLRIVPSDMYSDDNSLALAKLLKVDVVITGFFTVHQEEEILVQTKILDVEKEKPILIRNFNVYFDGGLPKGPPTKLSNLPISTPKTAQEKKPEPKKTVVKEKKPKKKKRRKRRRKKRRRSRRGPGASTTASPVAKPPAAKGADAKSMAMGSKVDKVDVSNLKMFVAKKMSVLAIFMTEMLKKQYPPTEAKKKGPQKLDSDLLKKSDKRFFEEMKEAIAYREKQKKYPWGGYFEYIFGFNILNMNIQQKYNYTTPYTNPNPYPNTDGSHSPAMEYLNEAEGDTVFGSFNISQHIRLGGYWNAFHGEIGYKWYRQDIDAIPMYYEEVNAIAGTGSTAQITDKSRKSDEITYNGALISHFDLKLGWRSPSYLGDYGYSYGYINYRIARMKRHWYGHLKAGTVSEDNVNTALDESRFDTSHLERLSISEEFLGHALGLGYRSFGVSDSFDSETVKSVLNFEIMFGPMIKMYYKDHGVERAFDNSVTGPFGLVGDLRLGYGLLFPKLGAYFTLQPYAEFMHFNVAHFINNGLSRWNVYGNLTVGIELMVGFDFDSQGFLPNIMKKDKPMVKK